MNANDIIDEAFDEFASQFDHESNEWLGTCADIFAAGWKAALKSSLPAETVSEAMVGEVAKAMRRRRFERTRRLASFDESVPATENELDDARAALEAAALAHADDGWQPIETAPKDGTWVLLAGPSGCSTTPLRVEVCRWYPEYRPRNPWQNHSNDAFTDGGESPTHWRPLPAPPVGDR